VSEEKDLGLGVIVSKDMKWEKQCSAVVLKANRILGMIKRNFVNRIAEVILALYKSLVRPHLEYCMESTLLRMKKLLKGVQRHTTKLVQGIEHKSYEERLQK